MLFVTCAFCVLRVICVCLCGVLYGYLLFAVLCCFVLFWHVV